MFAIIDLAAAEWLSQVSSVLTSTVVTSTIVTPDPSTGGMEDTRPRSHPNPIGAGIPGPGSFPVDPGSMDRAIDSSFGTVSGLFYHFSAPGSAPHFTINCSVFSTHTGQLVMASIKIFWPVNWL